MSYSGNEDILKDQVWFYSCELLEGDFHYVIFKQWGDKSERTPKAAFFAMFNPGSSRNISVGKLFKYLSFLYEKYCSLFTVNYHGLVTCSLEYPHRMCTGRAFSYQQQHSCAELSTQFTTASCLTIADFREHLKAAGQLSAGWLLFSPVVLFPPMLFSASLRPVLKASG